MARSGEPSRSIRGRAEARGRPIRINRLPVMRAISRFSACREVGGKLSCAHDCNPSVIVLRAGLFPRLNFLNGGSLSGDPFFHSRRQRSI